jgi:arylsulfatase
MADTFVEYGLKEPFPGKLGKTIDDSTEAWPMPIQAPEGAPNVIFYVFDDIGFGQLEPFGGLVKAPRVKRILERGLGYTNFHPTGLCSPTRTCIITGRNHHSNGMGAISEWSTGFPGYDGRILPSHGFISETLNISDYNTFGLGKWHLSVATEETMAGWLSSASTMSRRLAESPRFANCAWSSMSSSGVCARPSLPPMGCPRDGSSVCERSTSSGSA